MKQLKTKLIVTVAMLLIATVMMSTASYAWFTLSTKPEIDGLKTTVVVNENLEIAYKNDGTAPDTSKVDDTGRADTYGNLISTTLTTKDSKKKDENAAIGDGNFSVDYKGIETTLRPIVLGDGKTDANAITTDGKDLDNSTKPADSTNLAKKGKFYFPVYGDDGRVEKLVECIELDIPGLASNTTTGFGYIIIPDEKKDKDNKPTGEYCVAGTGDKDVKVSITKVGDNYVATVANGKIAGYYVDNWVRSNIVGYLAISSASDTVRSTGAANYTEQKGDGSYFLANTAENKMTTDQQEELAKNIRVAFKFGTSSTYETYDTLGIAGEVEDNSDSDTTEGTYRLKDGTADGATILGQFMDESVSLTDYNQKGDIKQAQVNSDCVLRLYFYLDGREVSNKIASTSSATQSNTNGIIVDGEWNLQFKVVQQKSGGGYEDRTTNSMDSNDVK